jgi:hypothetical protein
MNMRILLCWVKPQLRGICHLVFDRSRCSAQKANTVYERSLSHKKLLCISLAIPFNFLILRGREKVSLIESVAKSAAFRRITHEVVTVYISSHLAKQSDHKSFITNTILL